MVFVKYCYFVLKTIAMTFIEFFKKQFIEKGNILKHGYETPRYLYC